MIGHRIKWTGVFDGETVEESGEVIAIERGGSPAIWSILAISDGGKFRSPVLDRIEYISDNANSARDAEESLAALEYLERWINEQFPGVEDAGGGPIERATQLLSQLKAELIEVGAERDKLAANLEKAKAKPAKSARPKPGASITLGDIVAPAPVVTGADKEPK